MNSLARRVANADHGDGKFPCSKSNFVMFLNAFLAKAHGKQQGFRPAFDTFSQERLFQSYSVRPTIIKRLRPFIAERQKE